MGSRIVAASLLALLSGGCGIGRALDPRSPVDLAAGDGLFIVATDAERPVELSLCVDGDRLRCVRAGPVSPARSLIVYAIPAGRYCVMSVRHEAAGGDAEWDLEDRYAPCYQVSAGALVYPGHLSIRPTSQPIAWDRLLGFHHVPMVQAQLDTAYPHLAGRELSFPEPTHVH